MISDTGPGQDTSCTSATSCGSGCVAARPSLNAWRASSGVNVSNGGRPAARIMASRVSASGSSGMSAPQALQHLGQFGRAISVGAAGSASEPTLKNPCPRIHDQVRSYPSGPILLARRGGVGVKGRGLGAGGHCPRLWPPPVLPVGEQTLHLRQDFLGEQLRVVARQLLAHVAELQQQHQVADIEVDGDLAKLLSHLVARTDNHVAALDNVVHLTGKHLELVLIARRCGAGGALHLAFDPSALGCLADVARGGGEPGTDMQAAAVEIFGRLSVELERLGTALSDADELQKTGAVWITILAEPLHFLPEPVH